MNYIRRLKTAEEEEDEVVEKKRNIFKLNLRGHRIERHALHTQMVISIIIIVICVKILLSCCRKND